MSVADPVFPEYLWIVVCCALASFFLGIGVGANDLGNSFATVVGSRTLSIRSAMILAIIFETLGSMILGRTITGTIQSGIADLNAFTREPQVFAYGMLCAVFVTGVWQLVAQYYEINVASGQSLVGSIIGFSLVYKGKDAVLWSVKDPKSWPPYKGMVAIVLTWFFSPIFTMIVSCIFFFTIRSLVLRRQNAHKLAPWVLPPAVLVTSYVCIFFVLEKGARKYILEHDKSWNADKAAWISAAVSGGLTVLSAVAMIPLMKWMENKHFGEDGQLTGTKADAEAGAAEAAKTEASTTDAKLGRETSSEGSVSRESSKDIVDPTAPWYKRWAQKSWYWMTYGLNQDVHASIAEDDAVATVHNNCEVFDSRAEHIFTYLQIFSAICVMFAHGAGEVGYMAGPLSTAWTVYTEGVLPKNVEPPIWTTIIGTVSMCLGLVTIGYKMIIAMGVKLTRLSPSRGFCAELATALVTLIASQWGLPTGGSQCIVGGIVGVGLLEGKLGINWKFFAKQWISWVATIFLMGLGTAALFAQGIYAPGKIEGAAQIKYEDALSATSVAMFDNYRAMLESYRDATAAGAIPRLTTAQLTSYSAQLRKLSTDAKTAAGTKQQTVQADVMISYLQTALSLYQSDSVLTVGQTTVFPNATVCNNNVTTAISNGVTAPCRAPQMLPKGVASTWPPA